MGAIGRYLDGLDDDARDRVIEGRDWTTSESEFVDPDGCRRLVGHAEDWYLRGAAQHSGVGTLRTLNRRGMPVYALYPDLVKKVGLDRAVALIKARAARGVTSRVVEIAPEAVAR